MICYIVYLDKQVQFKKILYMNCFKYRFIVYVKYCLFFIFRRLVMENLYVFDFYIDNVFNRYFMYLCIFVYVNCVYMYLLLDICNSIYE